MYAYRVQCIFNRILLPTGNSFAVRITSRCAHCILTRGKGASLKNLLSISQDFLGEISVYVFDNDVTDLNLA